MPPWTASVHFPWFVSYRRLSSQFQFSLSVVTLGYLSQCYIPSSPGAIPAFHLIPVHYVRISYFDTSYISAIMPHLAFSSYARCGTPAVSEVIKRSRFSVACGKMHEDRYLLTSRIIKQVYSTISARGRFMYSYCVTADQYLLVK